MTYRKTWISYVLWAVFACVTGILLADYTILFWKTQISAVTGIYMIGFVFIVFALVAGVYFLLRTALSKICKEHAINEHTALMWEIFAVLCIFVAALFYRFYLCMQNDAGSIIKTQFYDMAIVREGTGVKPLVHGASYLYVQFLSLVFSFLGNKPIAAVWMQILIEIAALLLSYFTIRKALGRIPACVVMFTLALSSVYTGLIFTLTPEVLFFLLYMLALFIIAGYIKAYCNNRLNLPLTLLGAFMSGIVIGLLIYLDALSLTLLIILTGLVTGVGSRKNKYWIFLLAVITCILTVAGLFLLDSYASGTGIEAIAKAWVDLYCSHLKIDYVIYQDTYSVVECLILLILAALFIPAFWNRKKTQNASPWICIMLLLAPTPLAKTGVLPYQIYSVVIWSILAGIGLQQSLTFETERADVPQEPIPGEEPLFDKAVLSDETLSDVSALAVEDAKPEVKPRFIENPLPLPKKHEKRELGYQYEVAPDKMKFDVEVKDNDDFDR